MVNVFEYQNYRTYLKDYYQEQKKKRKYFSYRYFSEKAGINASAFLYYVIENKRNLTKNSISKIIQAIGFDTQQAAYFENLVFFNQAKSIQDKTLFYSKIVEIRNPIDIHNVDKDSYGFYSRWYISVIREIVPFVNFKDDYKKLGEYLEPSITQKEAKEAIDILERLGFIERDDDGLYHQTNNLLSARPAGEQAFVIEKLQLEMLEKAMQSFDLTPRPDRMSASTTFSISKAAFDLFQQKTREFRKELMEIARVVDNPDQVYQFTFNLFPVSKKLNDE